MRKTNILYRILLLAYTTSSFSEGIILPIYAIFVQRIGGDVLDAGFAMGIFLITDGIFTILIHRLKWNRKQRTMLMIIGWIVWIAGICMYLFISNLEMLFLTQFLTALGNAIANPIFDQELAEHVDKENAEFEWGLYSVPILQYSFGGLQFISCVL
jgi:Na+/melibiose symporter-like transporter